MCSNDELKEWLVCPLCKGQLRFETNFVTCTSCQTRFPQTSSQWFDLFPQEWIERHDETRWQDRQQEMTAWYASLSLQPAETRSCYDWDYSQIAPLLNTISGLVLDIGGGNGVARDYLPPDTTYVNLEPSTAWMHENWRRLSAIFPSLASPPNFVRGIGEYVPLSHGLFDAALALWTLNHTSQPRKVFQEIHRVLKEGARFIVVLEDMEPRWYDILMKRGPLPRKAAIKMKLRSKLTRHKWPVQSDHLRISESEIRKWIAGKFIIVQRTWTGNYLTFVFLKNS